MFVYWAKILTDHPKNCDDFFVVQYFGIVHYTMELTLVGSEVPYTLTKKFSLMTRSTKGIRRLTNQLFFPFKTNVNKCDFECPIHGVKLKARK